MANQQLVDYIKAQLALGVTKPDIQKVALGAKWPLQEIESAFAAAEGRAAAPAPLMQAPRAVAPVVQPVQPQPLPQQKPLPVIHMHPQDGLLHSPLFLSLVVLLAAVVAAAGAYFLTPVGDMVTSYFAPAPAQEVEMPPIPTMRSYTDETYGFSVTYPRTLSRVPGGADTVFALPNFVVSATTSPKGLARCAPDAKAATTTINDVEFVVKTATSTASTTVQTYSAAHSGACFVLGVLDMSADPVLQSFRFVATSTPVAASTTVQQ